MEKMLAEVFFVSFLRGKENPFCLIGFVEGYDPPTDTHLNGDREAIEENV